MIPRAKNGPGRSKTASNAMRRSKDEAARLGLIDGKAKFLLHEFDDGSQSFPGYLSIHSTKPDPPNLPI